MGHRGSLDSLRKKFVVPLVHLLSSCHSHVVGKIKIKIILKNIYTKLKRKLFIVG